MMCSRCGRAERSEAKFCSECGGSLSPYAPAQTFGGLNAFTGRLVRPWQGRMVAGVCAGVAQQLGWDVALVRFVVALSILFAGVPLIAYAVAWLVIPNAPHALPAGTAAPMQASSSYTAGTMGQ